MDFVAFIEDRLTRMAGFDKAPHGGALRPLIEEGVALARQKFNSRAK